MASISFIVVLLLSTWCGFLVYGQDLIETSGWALRGNGSCSPSSSICGKTVGPFLACCPAFARCIPQYNSVCCPLGEQRLLARNLLFERKALFLLTEPLFTIFSIPLFIPDHGNCTDALVEAGPRCADPSWILCDNGGYFCCLPGQTCYSNGNTDGCADPDYELGPLESPLPMLNQVPQFAAVTNSPSSTISITSTSLSTATTKSSSNSNSNGLDTSDKIAIGIGIPVGIATLLGVWFAWKAYQHKLRHS